MSAVLEDDLLVSQPEVKRLYMSRRSQLRLVKTPRYPMHGPGGQKVGEKPGEVIPFVDGVFRCPASGKVTLEDGREADAQEVSEWLERHRLLGDIEEGFWTVDPVAPPISGEELDRLVEAALGFDKDTLRRILEQERAGWGREDLIRQAEKSLATIDDTEKRVAAEAEAARQAQEQQPDPAAAAALEVARETAEDAAPARRKRK